MATDIVRAAGMQSIVAVNDLDDGLGLDILDDPVEAAALLAGMDPRDALYSFKQGGSTIEGISVDGAFAMAAKIGGFEIHEPRFEEVTVRTQDGEGDWVETDYVRCTVRVTHTDRDGRRLPNTFVGVAEEPRVLARRDGTTTPNPHSGKVAQAKAERNALLRHLAKAEAGIKRLAHAAIEAGQVFMTGEATPEAEQASRATRTAQAQRRAKQSSPIGPKWVDLFGKAMRKTADESGADFDDIKTAFLRLSQLTYTGVPIKDQPSSQRAVYENWLNELRADHGLQPIYGQAAAAQEQEPEQAPAALPDPDPTDDTPDPQPEPEQAAEPKANGKAATKGLGF